MKQPIPRKVIVVSPQQVKIMLAPKPQDIKVQLDAARKYLGIKCPS